MIDEKFHRLNPFVATTDHGSRTNVNEMKKKMIKFPGKPFVISGPLPHCSRTTFLNTVLPTLRGPLFAHDRSITYLLNLMVCCTNAFIKAFNWHIFESVCVYHYTKLTFLSCEFGMDHLSKSTCKPSLSYFSPTITDPPAKYTYHQVGSVATEVSRLVEVWSLNCLVIPKKHGIIFYRGVSLYTTNQMSSSRCNCFQIHGKIAYKHKHVGVIE